MKKITFFLLALLGTSSMVFAQKPDAGDITAEMNLNLTNLGLFHGNGNGSGNPFSLNNDANQIRMRYFISPSLAARLGLNINASSNKQNFSENPDGTGATGSARKGSFGMVLTPGIEKHFAGGEKLSTFAGADLILDFKSYSEKWENSDGDSYVRNQNAEVSGGWATGDNRSYFGIGLRAVAGADYYFTEKLYLGAEFGWGF
ncbi:MAG: hypothetical protein NZ108_05625, partial [Bacteroidia bacterium]|nr:hypothetical protein [Bacteroidia bacterium]